MDMHTDPGWWLVWMLYGSLITIFLATVVDHIKSKRRSK